MKLRVLIAALPLVGCMQPPPPCPDEACVEQRQATALMILGIMAAQHQHQSEQEPSSLLTPIQPYQEPSSLVTPIPEPDPYDQQGQIDDLQDQVQTLQSQVNNMRNGGY